MHLVSDLSKWYINASVTVEVLHFCTFACVSFSFAPVVRLFQNCHAPVVKVVINVSGSVNCIARM